MPPLSVEISGGTSRFTRKVEPNAPFPACWPVSPSEIRRDPLHLPIAIADRVQSPPSVVLVLLRFRQFQLSRPRRGPALSRFRQARARRHCGANNRARSSALASGPSTVALPCADAGSRESERASFGVDRAGGLVILHECPERSSTPHVRLAPQRQGSRHFVHFRPKALPPDFLAPASWLARSASYRRALGVMFEGWELWPWHHARQRGARVRAAEAFRRAEIRRWRGRIRMEGSPESVKSVTYFMGSGPTPFLRGHLAGRNLKQHRQRSEGGWIAVANDGNGPRLVRTGAALRALPARLSARPRCGCRGASSSRRPIRAPMIRPSRRIFSPGFFVFAGKVVHAQGQSPFEMAPPSPQWENLLNGFGWLRHLRVAENPLARTNARALITDFLRLRRNNGDPAWAPPVAARRLLSWISASPYPPRRRGSRAFIAVSCGPSASMPAISSSASGAVSRSRSASFRRSRFARSRFPPRPSRGCCGRRTGRSPREIRRCILEDGGHVSRSPRAIVDLLLDLLPLRHLFLAKNEDPPELLQTTLGRSLQLLRLLRLGDGNLGLFHGMGYMPADSLAIVFRYEHVSGEPLLSAPASGYERLAAGTTALLMDVGGPPPFAFSRAAHASALAFEFSDGPWRLVVNCGAPITGSSAAREAARHTAAHSTLVIADTSSCHFETRNARTELGAAIIDRPTPPKVLREENEAGTRLTAMHHGYARRFGLLHERGLALSPDGTTVHGLDALVDADPKRPPSAVPFALRFHLHPHVQATLQSPEGGHQARSSKRGFLAFRSRRVSGRCSRRASFMPRPMGPGGRSRSSSRLNPPSPARSPGASLACGSRKSKNQPPELARSSRGGGSAQA